MADTPENDEEEVEAQSSQPSLAVLIAVVLVLSLIAAGAGAGLGVMLPGHEPESATAQTEPQPEGAEQVPAYSSGESIMMLKPIVANLLVPRGTYIRVEGAALFDGPTDKESEVLVSRVTQDVMSLLSTMTLAQIEGPSGLQHLREDLNARAMARSDGKIKEIILHSMVVE